MRFADDTGSAIRTYHIDNFLGTGNDVVKAWMHGGVNGTRRQVKYIGEKNEKTYICLAVDIFTRLFC
ncbi:3D domain-containing protein [Pseudoduganella danionis]|uniref:3D domain-containing protein n=1 Tax=Pseudoduganella danionis TaxID=1890295 RepID=A0ABW9SQI8_9BURK|nr:hypothetical protein [Pseudoduganella danionis]